MYSKNKDKNLVQPAVLTLPRNTTLAEAADVVETVVVCLGMINDYGPGSYHPLRVETPANLLGSPSFLCEALGISARGAEEIEEQLSGISDSYYERSDEFKQAIAQDVAS